LPNRQVLNLLVIL